MMAQLNSLQSSDIKTESSPLLLRRIYADQEGNHKYSRKMNRSPEVSNQRHWGSRPFLIVSGIAAIVAVIVIVTIFTAGSSSPEQEIADAKKTLVLRAAPSADIGANDPADIIAETPLGKVKGYPLISRKGREYYAFYKVPYAKPPLKELRFEVSICSYVACS